VVASPVAKGLTLGSLRDRSLAARETGREKSTIATGRIHVSKDINKLVLDAVRRFRTAMSRRGKAGRKKNLPPPVPNDRA
jgi:hypothetical protein